MQYRICTGTALGDRSLLFSTLVDGLAVFAVGLAVVEDVFRASHSPHLLYRLELAVKYSVHH